MAVTAETEAAPAQYKEVELQQGTVRYRELGTGEPLVFLHGFAVDSRLWQGVAGHLDGGGAGRCILPDLPFGSHRIAMNPDADLSPRGVAALVADLVAALGLEGATVVGNDSGGAVAQLVAAHHPEVVQRLVLTNCDMYDDFPPFPYNGLPLIARVPGLMPVFGASLRFRPVRWASFRVLTNDPLPDDLLRSWLAPLRDEAIRRDAGKFMAGASGKVTTEVAERLRGFERPLRIAWGAADRFFKLDHARRLASEVPDGRVELIEGGKTFVPIEHPREVAALIREFLAED
jgi:pimeloyl-ACP methyl ester carboxylesterase